MRRAQLRVRAMQKTYRKNDGMKSRPCALFFRKIIMLLMAPTIKRTRKTDVIGTSTDFEGTSPKRAT